MELNKLPEYDMSDNPTGCCPRFHPKNWDNQELHFKNKPFVRAQTRSFFHIPVNMGKVFANTFENIKKGDGMDEEQFIVLTKDTSPWKSEHLFSVSKEIPGEEMEYLNGDYITRVFEGPYKETGQWYSEMEQYVKEKGKTPKNIYFFYTTCPKCAKYYGKNYVVGVAEIA